MSRRETANLLGWERRRGIREESPDLQARLQIEQNYVVLGKRNLQPLGERFEIDDETFTEMEYLL
ncbi:hypothetical protein HNR46_001185 [Haloferula luteola]|uniref:Uncharacterized protein n=1 Tax=Haloferula luteola TaxID=595692 RepID=A0A840VDN1_9BACT|nr:hypothetical protein [Haloferula luteola]MBB5350951.1 hypothetical protein [Haloferula luteola]